MLQAYEENDHKVVSKLSKVKNGMGIVTTALGSFKTSAASINCDRKCQ